ncbi:hypothetical protein IIA79_05975 [bacterium]|nr:hypothetical protein [bacterium]
MLFLYNALITLLWPLLYFYKPFRGTVSERLGNFPLEVYDPAAPGPRILVNAVSAGEVVAVSSFLLRLRQLLPQAQIALLTTTESGKAMAMKKLRDTVQLIAYFPLADLPFAVRRYLDRLKPSLYITTESELWPNIQSACRSRGIGVALVNARLYLHNKRGVRGWIVRRLYGLVDLIVCQDERQRDNFRSFGLPEELLAVSGNLKFDFEQPQWDKGRLDEWRTRFAPGDIPLIVAGSTHPGEEGLLLDALAAVRQALGPAHLVIAPRHIERADEVVALAEARGYRSLKLKEHLPGASCDVLVIDQYGLLVDFYRIAGVVVMGGTFHPKVGGHNILEATMLGKPVIVGPHTFSITAQLDVLRACEGVVETVAGEPLATAIAGLLSDPARATKMGEAARLATEANRGAAERAVDAVLGLLK